MVAGHEFSARIDEIMTLRKREGVKSQIAGNTGSYLKCPKAERAFEELLAYMRGQIGEDAIFDLPTQPPFLNYVDDDILRNGAFGYRHEEDLVNDF